MKKNNNQQLSIIKEIGPLTKQATSLEITDPASLKQATSTLSQLNKILDSIVEYKEKKTKPLNQALKAIRQETKPYEVELLGLIGQIRAKMSDYQTNLKNKEFSIINRISPGKGHLSVETALSKVDDLNIALEIETEEGTVQFREKKQLKITDLSLIPDEYWIVNGPLLLEDLKAGRNIPGCELETIQLPYNMR